MSKVKSGREAIPFLSSKIGDIRSKLPKAAVSPRKEEQEGQIFLSIQREVEELAALRLQGKDLKNFKKKKIEALGGKGEKNLKVPYKILQGMRKKDKERKEKARQAVQELGYAAVKSIGVKEKGEGRTEQEKKAAIRNELPLPKTGRFVNGMLKIGKSEVSAITKTTNKKKYNNSTNSKKHSKGGGGGGRKGKQRRKR